MSDSQSDPSDPAPLSITVFGPMQVLVHGQPLPAFRSRKPLWLLALLSLRPNRPVSREWLAGTLWPNSEQGQTFSNLRPVLSELRSALATESKRLQSPDRHTLVLDLTDTEVDILRFDAAIASGTLPDLEQAVALYRGPLLEGCHEEWALLEREAREQSYLQALQKLGDASLAGGDYDEAAGYYQRAVRNDPWQEAARRGWMEALARNGDTNAALQVYRELLAFLKDDPSAAPDEQTTALYQRLRTEVRQKAVAPKMSAPTVPSPSVQGYLPHPLTELIGREDERLEVQQQLRHSRLVSLTGVGGIGKTRLAREVASEVVREYADGVWLVALDSLTEGRLVIQQIASVLGLREARDSPLLQRVTDHLRQKRLLLVLDNCEHLREASAQVAAHLLRECAQVRILATSREALGITGETIWSVPALSVPDMEHLPQGQATLLRVLQGYESVQLFVERAQAVQKSFVLSGGNARLVAQACRQLEGIPLAIELAAARARAMSVEQIAARLDNYLGLLTAGNRPAQSRQQTLRATLDWSYALLSEAERSLLMRLSVFVGGCTLEAAEQICQGEGGAAWEVLDLLTSLVDKSLVAFEERESSAGRYRLLEMVRQYAAEGLQASGEAEPVRVRHRDWFLALAEEAEPQLRGADQINWLRRLEAEHDNLRVALSFSETEARGAQPGLRMAGALYRFWSIRGDISEGRAYLRRALEREGAREATAARAKALNGAGASASLQGDYVSAKTLIEESLAIRRELADKAGIANSLNSLGDIAYIQADYEAARTLYEESLLVSREAGDKHHMSHSLNYLGNVACARGEYGTAHTLYNESLALNQELEDKKGIANTLVGMASASHSQGDHEIARMRIEESLVIQRELSDKVGIAFSLYCLGYMAHDRGDYEAAWTLFEESLTIRREIADKAGTATSLNDLGCTAYSQGDYQTARTLIEEGLAIRREMKDKAGIAMSLDCLGRVAYDQGALEEAHALFKEGMSLYRETGHYSLTHLSARLGHMEREAGNYARASALYQESLLLRQRRGDALAIAQSLEDFAGLAGRQRQFARAARLLGAADSLCTPLGRTLSVAEPIEYERTVTAARQTLGEAAFATSWEEGRALTQEQAIAFALETPHERT